MFGCARGCPELCMYIMWVNEHIWMLTSRRTFLITSGYFRQFFKSNIPMIKGLVSCKKLSYLLGPNNLEGPQERFHQLSQHEPLPDLPQPLHEPDGVETWALSSRNPLHCLMWRGQELFHRHKIPHPRNMDRSLHGLFGTTEATRLLRHHVRPGHLNQFADCNTSSPEAIPHS